MAEANRPLDDTHAKLGKEDQPDVSGQQGLSNWVQENVLSPVYDTLVVEPGNALRQTVNYVARPLLNKDLIEPRLEPTHKGQAQFLGGEWWTQNIGSGLAAAAVYTVAGKLTGGALRGLHSKTHKLGIQILTSELGLKSRPVTDVVGYAGNFASRVVLNEKVAQVVGAACYDGMKETRPGETNLGNMAGGAASFTVFEAGNALVGSKFKTAASLGLIARTKVELAKAGLRTIPGALGSGAQVVASYVVSGQELPTDQQSWSESVVTGGAMNAVLPWFQHGIGKGIDAVNVHMKKTIPYQRFNRDIQSPLLKELSNCNPEVRVKLGAHESKALGQRSEVHLPEGVSEAEQGHEIWHVQAKKNFDRARDMHEVQRLIAANKLSEAWDKYVILRVREEVLGMKIEDAIRDTGIPSELSHFRWSNVHEGNLYWQRVLNDNKYRFQYESDFQSLIDKRGCQVTEIDYAGKTRYTAPLAMEEVNRLFRCATRESTCTFLGKQSIAKEWMGYQLVKSAVEQQDINGLTFRESWKTQLDERGPVQHNELLRLCQQVNDNPDVLVKLAMLRQTIGSIPFKHNELIASRLYEWGIAPGQQAKQFAKLYAAFSEQQRSSFLRSHVSRYPEVIAKLTKVEGIDQLTGDQVRLLAKNSELLSTREIPSSVPELLEHVQVLRIIGHASIPASIINRVLPLPLWQKYAAALAWKETSEFFDNHDQLVVTNQAFEKEAYFWNRFDHWVSHDVGPKLVFPKYQDYLNYSDGDFETHERYMDSLRAAVDHYHGRALSQRKRDINLLTWTSHDMIRGHVNGSESTNLRPAALVHGLRSKAFFDAFTYLDPKQIHIGDSSWERRSALALALTFGPEWRRWLLEQHEVGRNAHDATQWLPIAPTNKLEGLAGFLFKYQDCNLEKLRVVAKYWEHLTDEKRMLSLNKLYSMFAGKKYPLAQSEGLANEAGRWAVSEDSYSEIERRWLASLDTPSPFPLDQVWTCGEFRGRFIPRNDPRGLFLGQHTDCCQHVDHESGRDCAWYGQESPKSGFFIVEDAQGNVIAQSWAWLSDNGGLCFDSIEAKELGTRRKAVRTIYSQAASSLVTLFPTVTVGGSMMTFAKNLLGNEKLSLPQDYKNQYSDAKRRQTVLARRQL